jgi:hypothetical protein
VAGYNEGAFSFQTAYGSGKPKAVWVFNAFRPCALRRRGSFHKTWERELREDAIYDSGHVGWTSISNLDA